MGQLFHRSNRPSHQWAASVVQVIPVTYAVATLDICGEDVMDCNVGVSSEVILTYPLLDYGL